MARRPKVRPSRRGRDGRFVRTASASGVFAEKVRPKPKPQVEPPPLTAPAPETPPE